MRKQRNEIKEFLRVQITSNLKLSDSLNSQIRKSNNFEAKLPKKNNTELSTQDIYQYKLIKEFEAALVTNGLQLNNRLQYEDLKKILGTMNLISLNWNKNKWEKQCKSLWKILTTNKSNTDSITIRSAKIFILGIWGIDSQLLYDAIEADSTPSTSTGESKIFEEFIFTSPEHLSWVKSKFYEMVLHKLTFVKHSKSKSEKIIKEFKTETQCFVEESTNKAEKWNKT